MIRGCTTKDEHNITYEWEIKKFDTYLSYVKFGMKSIESTKFSSGSPFKDIWCLKSVFRDGTVEIVLCLLSNHSLPIETKYSFFILDNEKKKVFMKSYHSPLSTGEETYLILSKKNWENNEDRYLPNNILTVGLDLSVFDEPITISSEFELKIAKRPMAQDYKEFYLAKIETDVTINVGDEKFRAHKSILMARSCVLAAMFNNEMIEKKENTVTIPDIDPQIFEKILEFIYTDQVSDLDENAELLLEGADKYQLQSLKEMCEESLSKTLTFENAFKLSIFADFHNANHLLKFTDNFILLNVDKVFNTLNFDQLEKSNLYLILKLLRKHPFPMDKN
ncbi:speckle-type POZ protein-like [Cotesia glomerata]|uniref:speckle-type POZ protein-like n=1 Tax=Cotesia glomerata TaxID=32391 RepID=UPI001D026C81|nr:speckle-type POZ protein-like [Cotesia glomerata]